MATLTVNEVARAGTTRSLVSAAGGGDSFAPGRDTFFCILNGGGSAITVTLATPSSVLGDLAVADLAVSVPAGGDRLIGPLPPDDFANTSTGLCDVTYSSVTSVTVGAFKLPGSS